MTVPTAPTLAEFLLDRIAEDEAAARAASPGGWQYGNVASVAGGSLYDETRMIGSLHYEQLNDHDGRIVRHLLSDEADANGAHIARHDPARVLAECEAKRGIVETYIDLDALGGTERLEQRLTLRWTCGLLALPYASHADYRDEFRP